jgi:hypothetical protein
MKCPQPSEFLGGHCSRGLQTAVVARSARQSEGDDHTAATVWRPRLQDRQGFICPGMTRVGVQTPAQNTPS